MGGGGGKVPYPKHVWSPAGGWYTQPANWKQNTAVMGVIAFGFVALAWKISSERETRTKMPAQGIFYPSRWWTKQIREHEAGLKSSSS